MEKKLIDEGKLTTDSGNVPRMRKKWKFELKYFGCFFVVLINFVRFSGFSAWDGK